MELGGAERALLGLLNAFDPDRVDVDLFLNQHTGDFMTLIPSWVRLLPEQCGYNAIERPMRQIVREGQWRVALARLRARRKHAKYAKTLTNDQRAMDASIFQYVMSEVDKILPPLAIATYDLAISFLQPHNFVLSKVRARKKICWIHTDYSTVHVNVAQELPLWAAYDHIVSISTDCTRAFLKTFPSLAPKIIEIENILSPAFVRAQAEQGIAPELQTLPSDVVKIVSVGRISHAKNYDNVPHMAARLKQLGVRFMWTIVGPGDHADIDRTLAETGTADVVQFLGPRSNPYPYIAAADIYCQPSRYEGKSVTVREAQMLCRPVLITAYPTAQSQVRNGQDGMIAPMDNAGCAAALVRLINDEPLRAHLTQYCQSHDFGNEKEVNKIYELLN